MDEILSLSGILTCVCELFSFSFSDVKKRLSPLTLCKLQSFAKDFCVPFRQRGKKCKLVHDLSISFESSQLQKGHLYFSGDDTHEVKVVLQDKEITADLEFIHSKIGETQQQQQRPYRAKRRKTKALSEHREVIVIDDCDDDETDENEKNVKDKMKL